MKFLVVTEMSRDPGLAQNAVAAARGEAAGSRPNSEGPAMPTSGGRVAEVGHGVSTPQGSGVPASLASLRLRPCWSSPGPG